jgi:methylenetetrahydrofolate reductase (NADPH)
MSTAAEMLSGSALKARIVEFMRAASTEITPHDEERVPSLAAILPPRTMVYVAHTPRASLQDVVRVALCVQRAGLRAVPHIVARRIESARIVREAARELADGGIEQALVIAGDLDRPVGPFSSSLEVLERGGLISAGIRTFAVAGHPEGHRAIGPAVLWNSLLQKQVFAAQAKVTMRIVTQFGFDPAAICAWYRYLDERAITLPVHVGVAGPAPLSKLVTYAMQCGVGASLRGILRNMPAMRNVVGLALSPDEMVTRLLIERPADSSRMAGPHFFCFGGAVATGRWLRAVSDGFFDLPAEGGRFRLRA